MIRICFRRAVAAALNSMQGSFLQVYDIHMRDRKIQFLDGTALKLIAIICMVLDHTGDNFFPEQVWMRAAGRIALPVFAFCLAEGWTHTRSKKDYLVRLGIFSLVSEIPFDLVTAGKLIEFSHQNIMVTFFWSLLTLYVTERAGLSKKAAAAACVLSAVLSVLLGMDYSLLGPGLIFIWCMLKDRPLYVRNGIAALYYVLLRNIGIYWFGLLGILLVCFYNGRKGKGLKWLFYAFYPGHLLVIWLLKTFVFGS